MDSNTAVRYSFPVGCPWYTQYNNVVPFGQYLDGNAFGGLAVLILGVWAMIGVSIGATVLIELGLNSSGFNP